MRLRSTTIGRPLAVALAAAAMTITPAAAPAQNAAVRSEGGTLQVATNRGQLITLSRPMSDLFVANPEIADVQVRSPTQLYVFGKKAGETTVSATAKSGAVVYATTVRVGNNFDSLGQMLALAMPEANVTATTLNGIVLLTGTVASPDDGAEAERLVQAFVGEGTTVVSRLRTATPLQVNLQVRFAEVTRSFAKNIGANLTTIDGTGGFKFGVGSGRPVGTITTDPRLPLGVGGTVQGYTIDPTSITYLPNGQIDPTSIRMVQRAGTTITPGSDRTTLGFLTKLLGLNLAGALDLGERIGQVTSLANPNLTALSGETGTFLAGGEIPIPIAQGLGGVGVEYKQYGVSLAYTPTVLADGRISLRVRPEVSQLDYSNAVTVSGAQVPGLTTRRTETTVELGSGQSFMIAGLLQNNHNNSIEKTPGVGDVPILGALFRSNGFQRGETELVIVITPYLVQPVNGNDIKLPTDGYKSPTDVERILMGQLSSGTTGGDRPKPSLEAGPPAAPAIGATTPIMPAIPVPLPGKEDDGKDAKASRKGKKGKNAAPVPGFSIN
ncbi:type II and III secretion system protein family protein [Sphingomonas jeddahensis]|uniref:Type IV pilus biogenesis and competence protein PilQ n=1 Tax=Sphingomonas jeddahensis TaxID=1915074 RepID=A0A1V2EUJ0_9SPHN|nr:type II and III secretion system protein family protein [Sphingomonas jeddahensis]ONF96260.1 Type IV pilus biogenesis and competence protein PilQ precursor [Sphingomonas jeddahensis]